jgi:soluble lytic murein transglycosylase-like protein
MYANGVGAPQDSELAGAWLRVAGARGGLEARKLLALIGDPPRGRQPRCTYTSRYDRYAIATIPAVPTEQVDSVLGEVAPLNGAQPLARARIEQWVRQLAPRYGLDPNLVLAVIKVESNFNIQALSAKNARGLMQLIPDTAARFGVEDPTNPIQNLHGGMAYLRWLLAFFRGDLRLALAGYNAGERAVEQYLGIPPYRETRAYVRKVIRNYGRTTHPPVEIAVKPSSMLRVNLAPQGSQ